MLRRRSSAGRARCKDLQLRVHVLRTLCRRSFRWTLPELRRSARRRGRSACPHRWWTTRRRLPGSTPADVPILPPPLEAVRSQIDRRQRCWGADAELRLPDRSRPARRRAQDLTAQDRGGARRGGGCGRPTGSLPRLGRGEGAGWSRYRSRSAGLPHRPPGRWPRAAAWLRAIVALRSSASASCGFQQGNVGRRCGGVTGVASEFFDAQRAIDPLERPGAGRGQP